MKDVLAVVMAGGRGERLRPLTEDRCKPAVPFGGIYRLIDIPLSNCVNSGIYKILVFPQYKSQSLVDHLEEGWLPYFSRPLGHYMKIVAPQQRMGEQWYRGTADSVRQNMYLIEREHPRHVLILSGDHVYKMDYSAFRKYHEEKEADVTVSLLEVDISFAHEFGIAQVDDDFRIIDFEEKPREPKAIPGDPDHALASMGIYIFRWQVLEEVLKGSDAEDFGKEIIPELIKRYRVYAYPYRAMNRIRDYVYEPTDQEGIRRKVLMSRTRDSAYWRDVGTIDAYWNANMDLTGVDPFFSLYGELWPLRTLHRSYPPAKFVFNDRAKKRVGAAYDSIISPGCIVSGGTVRHSVLGYNVYVHSFAEVDESVILDNVEIGRHCRIKKAIIDKDNNIPPGTEIGINPREDMKTFHVTPRGIVVVPKAFFR
ncbi:glucose-1-phosphate adenylyltransferase [Thermodesulforhabdus norvegica]|uniref:Glucose-1-phosphate adenylyltransferase n=1 Tax=Thermodesulforhabdus norvegica TaxID=39841 RepID=A0A1I4RIA7_9BACT|nr:glucose-1-phosphate adenylyltransferase [Thermodesulforhabdus norvegica]SFM51998.1 glucose-1-phosphate adenylyltransferase [Thermodesulforhabdus norvegica]